MQFRFLTPVWGEEFTQRYVTTFLPAQFPNLKNFSDSVYKIITTPGDEAVIRSSASFKELSSMIEVRILLLTEENTNNYRRMSHGYEIGMEGEPADTPFVYLTPDSIFSLGSFDKLRELASRGYRAVMVAGPRVNLEGFLEDLRNYPQGLTGRQLSALTEKHLHKQFHSFMPGKDFHNTHPAALYWRVDGGLVARHFVQHPLFVRSKRAIKAVEETIDYNVATFVKRSEIYVCTDSDEIMAVDVGLQELSQGEIRPGPLTDKEVLAWLRSDWPTRFHRWLGRHALFFHSKDIGPRHLEAARQAKDFVRSIYRRIPPLGFLYSPIETIKGMSNVTRNRAVPIPWYRRILIK